MLLRSLRFVLLVAPIMLIWVATGNSSNGQDYFHEGYMASMKRDWNSAIDLFDKAIDSNPKNTAAYIQRASAYQMVDRIDDAIRDYEEVLRLNPNYYLAMEYLANLYEVSHQYAKAIETYNRSLPLVKDQKWRSVIQGKILDARKKATNARADTARQPNR